MPARRRRRQADGRFARGRRASVRRRRASGIRPRRRRRRRAGTQQRGKRLRQWRGEHHNAPAAIALHRDGHELDAEPAALPSTSPAPARMRRQPRGRQRARERVDELRRGRRIRHGSLPREAAQHAERVPRSRHRPGVASARNRGPLAMFGAANGSCILSTAPARAACGAGPAATPCGGELLECRHGRGLLDAPAGGSGTQDDSQDDRPRTGATHAVPLMGDGDSARTSASTRGSADVLLALATRALRCCRMRCA